MENSDKYTYMSKYNTLLKNELIIPLDGMTYIIENQQKLGLHENPENIKIEK